MKTKINLAIINVLRNMKNIKQIEKNFSIQIFRLQGTLYIEKMHQIMQTI